jgi:L-ascorbate metabolism protein UlaG (beta-lactamase superfamily)
MPRPEPTRDAITWLGHATCLIELGKLRAITDPVLGRGVGHLRRWEHLDRETARGIDVVLLSHAHHDHLDIRSLRWLAQHCDDTLRIVAPPGAARVVERMRIAEVERVVPGDTFEVDGIPITVVKAEHDGNRHPWSRALGDEQAVGYVLRGDHSVYFAGDTDVFSGMREFGPVDVALLPIGGWWKTLGPGHMDSSRAVDAAKLVWAHTAIPIHWGTFRPLLAGHLMKGVRHDAAHEFRAIAAERLPSLDVRILEQGEYWPFDGEPAADSTGRPRRPAREP